MDSPRPSGRWIPIDVQTASDTNARSRSAGRDEHHKHHMTKGVDEHGYDSTTHMCRLMSRLLATTVSLGLMLSSIL
jgi:hypothetical protein